MLDDWCASHLGSGVAEILFSGGHLSRVSGVRLRDGREAVVKVRPGADRLAGCADVHRALWRSGFPCPQPLVDPVPVGDGRVASAEVLVPGGELLNGGPDRYAALLADLIRRAPAVSSVRSLAPSPPWTSCDHAGPGLWPPPDDRAGDLNAHPSWLDGVGEKARRRLRRSAGAPAVIGHGDWEAQNLRWRGREPLAVHDWDSVIAAPEPVVAGLASAVWPCGTVSRPASIEESAAFLEAYQRAAGRRWTTDEIEVAWAAGLWVDAFNAKKASLDGGAWLTREEAGQRLNRAGY